ncbi:hypothetical protein COU79_04440 [Candidatus Peregrinibacteria bacterium CG10_big_fil_rev_8_21_14_0_10_54_7]|nr:MAG: hypothetical protein COU79_04440 [Candidatus Peregrinibacteria bacterium CG10_big_fil_rev_8_21_14_0_10_54_7]
MDETEKQEIVRYALEGSIDLAAMAQHSREFIGERKIRLEGAVQKSRQTTISPLLEQARERLRLFLAGQDRIAAFHAIAAETLGSIAQALQHGPDVPGRAALRALHERDIPPLDARIKVPEDFAVPEEIRGMVADALAARGMQEFEQRHQTTIDDPDGDLYTELCQAVGQALAAEGL